MDPPKGLMSLNDDCLSLIVEEVSFINYPVEYWYKQICKDLKHVKAFSYCNQRLRQLCIPKIFKMSDLVIRLHGVDEDLLGLIKSLNASTFAADAINRICGGPWKNPEHDTPDRFTGRDRIFNKFDMFGYLFDFLARASNLYELNLENLTTFNQDTKVKLRGARFNSIKVLHVARVTETPLLLAACPNLHTFRSEYPFAKPKTTLKAVASKAQIVNIELKNEKWTVKQLKEACEYLKNVQKLFLSGEIQARITDLAPELKALTQLRSLGMTTDPWLYYPYYEKNWPWGEDRYADAVSDSKYASCFNEDKSIVANAIVNACPALEELVLLGDYKMWPVEIRRRHDGSACDSTAVNEMEKPYPYSFLDVQFPSSVTIRESSD